MKFCNKKNIKLNLDEEIYIKIPDDKSYDIFLEFIEKNWPNIYKFFILGREYKNDYDYIIIDQDDIYRVTNAYFSKQIFEVSDLKYLNKAFKKLNGEI